MLKSSQHEQPPQRPLVHTEVPSTVPTGYSGTTQVLDADGNALWELQFPR